MCDVSYKSRALRALLHRVWLASSLAVFLCSASAAVLAMDARVTPSESRVSNLSALATSAAKGYGFDKVSRQLGVRPGRIQ